MENPTGEEGQLMRAAALLPGTRKRNRETSGSDNPRWQRSYGPFRDPIGNRMPTAPATLKR
jgi:hypothetical protein